MLVAAAGLRRAGASCGGFLPRSPRAENGDELVDQLALAFWAGNFFLRGEHDGFEGVLTVAAVVFENRHGFSLSGNSRNQARCALAFFCFAASRRG